MGIARAILAATAVECAALGSALSVVSLFGFRGGWPDVVAQFAPFWLAISLLAVLIAWPALAGFGGRALVLALAAVGVAGSAGLIAPELLRSVPKWVGAPPANTFTLVTYNIWGLNPAPAATIAQVLAQNADVVALQEMQTLPEGPLQSLKAVYPYQATCPQPCDVGLFSRRPWTALGEVSGGRLVFGVTTTADGAPVTIATTHFPWPLPTAGGARQGQELVRFVDGAQRPDLIVTGDFNLTPWSWTLRRLDAALAPLTRRERAVFTWPATIARLNLAAPFAFLPIDHVYAGPAWRTVAVRRLPRGSSDHYGLKVVLARAPGPR